MADDIEGVAALLHEVAETHHTVYRIADGEDPDWASWYADWLIRLSELPHLLKTTPVRSELVYLLVRLDRDYNSSKPNEPWERFYARRLLEHYLPVPAKS
ncbi:MAG: hypothetical protein E6I31_11785 [Chloroflexi bacterium]|nr:MAG: hypothetical protein E6I46_02395 [Chloroflexota bacterium]TMF20510.1 MAG: hypothetical protein E6I31_11785 [Chloroflexota bacterium]